MTSFCQRRRVATAYPALPPVRQASVVPATHTDGTSFNRDRAAGRDFSQIPNQTWSDRDAQPTSSSKDVKVMGELMGPALDLAKARSRRAADMTRRYASTVKFMAEEPQLAHRIGVMAPSGPESKNVQCALADNFNLDPLVDEATTYASHTLAVSARLDAISAMVERLTLDDFEVPPTNDSECERGNAFVRRKQLPIYLCFGFAAEVQRRPMTIVHEVAHLRGMNDLQYLKGKEEGIPERTCLKGFRFGLAPAETTQNPDSYAYFVADLGGQAR